jgi:CheY-like chemotaxis protein
MYKNGSSWLVDDDPIFVFALSKMLKRLEIFSDVTTFENGKAALEAIEQNPAQLPDVIFLDLNMPIMDGWQFLEMIEQSNVIEKLEILVLSSTVDPNDIDRLNNHVKIKTFVSKPVTLDKLRHIFGL